MSSSSVLLTLLSWLVVLSIPNTSHAFRRFDCLDSSSNGSGRHELSAIQIGVPELTVDDHPKHLSVHMSFNITAHHVQYSSIRPWTFDIITDSHVLKHASGPPIQWREIEPMLFNAMNDVMVYYGTKFYKIHAELRVTTGEVISCWNWLG